MILISQLLLQFKINNSKKHDLTYFNNKIRQTYKQFQQIYQINININSVKIQISASSENMGAQMSQLKPSQMTLPTKDGSSMKQVKHRTSLEEFILNCELNEVSPVRGKKNNQKSARIDSKMIPAVDRTEDEEEQDESFIHMGRQNLNSLNKIKKKISGANHKKIQVLSLLKQKNSSSGLEDYKDSIRHEDMRIIIDGNKNQSHFCIKTCRELGEFISQSSILRNEKQTNLMDYSHKSKKLYTINRR